MDNEEKYRVDVVCQGCGEKETVLMKRGDELRDVPCPNCKAMALELDKSSGSGDYYADFL